MGTCNVTAAEESKIHTVDDTEKTRMHRKKIMLDSGDCYQNERAIVDISNQRFGRLTALYPTEKRDKKSSVFWHCKCDCGNELDVTEDSLVHGGYRSCGCLREECKKAIPTQLHHVDGTCIEWLEKRKSRSDNTSGFRGVYPSKNGRFRVFIGFKR